MMEKQKLVLHEKLAQKAQPVKDFDSTFRTVSKSLPFTVLGDITSGKTKMVV